MTRRVLALCALTIWLVLPAAARADVTPAASASAVGNGLAAFSLTVPAGTDRLLVVGISTTSNVTVVSVNFGAQVLTRAQQVSGGGLRSETWTLVAPNAGTANVAVTLSGVAPVIAGAVSYTGVDQVTPIIAGSTGFQDNTPANAASFVANGTVQKDGMFGTIVISPVSGTSGEIFTQGSVDLVVADNRWATSTSTIRGAGSTRSGWTGANLSTNAGINWRWQRIEGNVPYAFSWVALRATTVSTPPAVSAPTATNIGQTSATLGGNLGSTGGLPITARGVVVCQCADPVIGGAGVTDVPAALSQSTGPFSVGVSGLTAARTYTYRAYATNALGTAYTAAATFDTLNTPPTANAGGPYTATEGSSLTLNGSGADANGDGLAYSWDVNGDGTYGDATGASPTLARAAREALGINDGPATFDVRVRVSDGKDTTTSASTTLTVANAVPDATVTNSGPVNEGSTASVSFTNVTDQSAADTAAGFRYAYDFNGDGTYELGGPTYAGAVTATSATVPAALLADGPGTRTVRMLVLDKDGVGHLYATAITVDNVAPTGTLQNVSGDEGQPLAIGLLNVSDPGNDPVRFIYDIDGNGTDDTAGVTYANATTATTSPVPAADGPATRVVRVRVIDKDGGSNVYTSTVTVANVAPTGALADQSLAEGQTATFALAGVADPGDLATLRYVYDFDGNGTDDTAGVTYANASTAPSETTPAGDGPATRTVRVRVIDKDGASNVYTATLTVTNVAPTAKLADVTVAEGERATVGLTDVADPADAADVRYSYDLDGNATDDTAGVTYVNADTARTADVPAALTADGPATVNVRVRVIDKDGGSNVYTADVDVDNIAPTATLADVTTAEGTPATVAFSGSADVSEADTAAGFTYEWDPDGDGTFTPGGGSITVPAPDGPATRTITGAILDRDGGRREYKATMTVTNAAPTVAITGPDAVPSSGRTTLALHLSDTGDDTLTSVLDWGDGTVDTVDGTGEKTVNHTYASAGQKTITLVATDSDGAKSATASHTLTVATAPASPGPTGEPTTPAAAAQTITRIKVTPRCLRADDLRARIAKTQTIKVRFSLRSAAPVKFTLQRLKGKGGASKCPPARGVKQRNGKRVPGVYRPFADKSINVAKGASSVTVAATGRKGKRLAPGTYLLIIDSNGVRARTKLWVLAP